MNKELYEAPTMMVVELKPRRILCDSPYSPDRGAETGINDYDWNTEPEE